MLCHKYSFIYSYISKHLCGVCAMLTSTTFLYPIPFTSPTNCLSLFKDACFTDFVFDLAVPDNYHLGKIISVGHKRDRLRRTPQIAHQSRGRPKTVDTRHEASPILRSHRTNFCRQGDLARGIWHPLPAKFMSYISENCRFYYCCYCYMIIMRYSELELHNLHERIYHPDE
jgi:hypothetical protein